MEQTATPTKIRFNPAVLIHSVEKKPIDYRTLGPITIAELSKELANIDKGIEFIPHTGDRDPLLDAFMEEKSTPGSDKSQNNTQY
jgi:hypothetical protein